MSGNPWRPLPRPCHSLDCLLAVSLPACDTTAADALDQATAAAIEAGLPESAWRGLTARKVAGRLLHLEAAGVVRRGSPVFDKAEGRAAQTWALRVHVGDLYRAQVMARAPAALPASGDNGPQTHTSAAGSLKPSQNGSYAVLGALRNSNKPDANITYQAKLGLLAGLEARAPTDLKPMLAAIAADVRTCYQANRKGTP